MVEEAFRLFRNEAPNSVVTMYVYIVDDNQQADPKSKLEEIMTMNVVTVAPETDRGGVEALFRRYHLRAIPVVDESERILGVVREKDVFSMEQEDRATGCRP